MNTCLAVLLFALGCGALRVASVVLAVRLGRDFGMDDAEIERALCEGAADEHLFI